MQHATFTIEFIETERNRYIYRILTAIFFGFHVAFFVHTSNQFEDLLFKLIQYFIIIVCLVSAAGFMVLFFKIEGIN